MSPTATRKDPAMLLRLPKALKQKIDAAARQSGRSRNTEVLARLAKSFTPEGAASRSD